MCECLDDLVQVAVCVRARALPDDQGRDAMHLAAAWAGHTTRIDFAMAMSAPIHYALAFVNVPLGGPSAEWLIADLTRLVELEEASGLHPGWRAYAGIWLAHMAAAHLDHTNETAVGDRGLRVSRRAFGDAAGISRQVLYAPPTCAELERDPKGWLQGPDALTAVPDGSDLARAAAVGDRGDLAQECPMILALMTLHTDAWRTWPTADLIRMIHHADRTQRLVCV